MGLPDLARMMLATGCRVDECLAIGWSEVDLDAATVDVRWRMCFAGPVRRVWRQVRSTLDLDGLVTHTLRKTVATFLDDADVSTRRISDQLGHAKMSMTQDRYLGRRLADRVTAEVLTRLFEVAKDETVP